MPCASITRWSGASEQAVADLVAGPDRDDLAAVACDPDVALEQVDLAERLAAQHALAAGRTRGLREPADHQVGCDARAAAHARP